MELAGQKLIQEGNYNTDKIEQRVKQVKVIMQHSLHTHIRTYEILSAKTS